MTTTLNAIKKALPIIAVVILFSATHSLAADRLLNAISERHMTKSASELETMAGGEDVLVKKLLSCRTDRKKPFVGVRCAKMLLGYADKPEVQAAIAEDMDLESRSAQARVYVVHIDQIEDESLRLQLAKLAVQRAKSSVTFIPFARVLTESSDKKVSAYAREALK